MVLFFGQGGQVYAGNIPTVYKNYIAPDNILRICTGDCIDLEPTLFCHVDNVQYEWSTGETTENIEVCPIEPTNYYLLLKDMDGNYLDSIPVFVDTDETVIYPPATTEVCAGGTVTLEACPESGTWTQSSANGFGATITPLAGGKAEVTFIELASGNFDFIHSVPGFSETITITVIPAPQVNVSNSQICLGQQVDLISNIPGGTWVNNNPSVAYINPYLDKAIALGPGTVTFTYTSPSGCVTETEPILVTNDIDAEFLGPDMICLGETTNVSPSTGGTWITADPSIATVTNAGIVTGVSSGKTVLIYTDSFNGCQSLGLEVRVMAPATELTGPSNICIGETTTITPSTGGSWSSDDVSIATIDNFGLITGVGTGYARFTFTDASTLCQSYPSEKVYVSTVNDITIDQKELCPGESTQLNADVPGTWASDNSSVATVNPTTGLVIAQSEGATTFTFTTSLGCSKNSNPVSLTVFSNSAEIMGPQTICVGSTTSIIPASGGEWSANFPGTVSIENGIVTGLVEGTASLVFTDYETGCESDPIEISIVTSLPAPNVSSNHPLCEGEDLYLSTDEVPGVSYAWTGPNGFTSSLRNPVITGITGLESGAYCLIISYDNCESVEECTDVVVNYIPNTPSVSNNGPICEYDALSLSTDFVVGATYSWSGPNGFSSYNQNPSIIGATFVDAGTYCVMTTIDGCESESSCTEVVIIPIPDTPVANNNGPLCEEESLELTTDAVTGASYIWSGPNGFSSTDQNPIISGATSNNHGTYCVVVFVDGCESLEGCTEVDSDCPCPITENTITLSGSNQFCEGSEALTIIGTDALPSGGTYTWEYSSNNGSFVAASGVNDQRDYTTNLLPEGEHIFRRIYTVSNPIPCDDESNIINVTVYPSPITPAASNNGPFCEGDQISLYTDFVAGASYSWTGPNSFTSTDQNPIISAGHSSQSGSYCVIPTVAGCESMVSCTDVYVKPTPATPIANSNTPICEGENIELTTSTVTNASYVWSGPNGFTSSEQNPVITNATPSNSGDYCVVVFVDGCESEESCTEVIVNPQPAPPVVSYNGPLCEGEDLVLTVNSVPGASYTWTGPNGYFLTIQNPTISDVSLSENGTFCVVINVNGCESQASCIDVIVKKHQSHQTF